jgi:glycogen operon protein
MYSQKHNEANGEDNRDGSDDNQSANWGSEGPSDDPNVRDLRYRTRRNLLMSLFLAQGVPLLLAGDEIGNSQAGNNNAYCQDNEVGWVDWSGLGREGEDNTDFIAKLTATRRRYRQLQAQHWLNGREGNQPPEILWLTPQASEMKPEDWAFPEARFLAYLLAGVGEDSLPLFTVMNAGSEPIEFVFPEFVDLENWSEILATIPGQNGGGQQFPVGAKYQAPSRSIMVFEGRK